MAEAGIDLSVVRHELESHLTRLNGELASLEKDREHARQDKDEYAGYGNHVAEAATETLQLLRTVVAPQLAEVYPQFAAEVFGIRQTI